VVPSYHFINERAGHKQLVPFVFLSAVYQACIVVEKLFLIIVRTRSQLPAERVFFLFSAISFKVQASLVHYRTYVSAQGVNVRYFGSHSCSISKSSSEIFRDNRMSFALVSENFLSYVRAA
jgi:hypothetical protein